MSRNLILAIILLIASSFFWSGNFFSGKIAFLSDLSPFKLSFFRWILALLILLPFTYNQIMKDLEYYNTVDLNNHHRLLRALSVCLESNKPYSIFLGKSKSVRNFKTKIFILHESRELLYKKINLRVDQMISNGLEGECKSLIKLRHLRPLQTVGYNEFFSYLDGNFSREFIIEEIKKNTRRYAKRQITWLKKYKTAEWINPKDASANILTNL